MTDFKKLIVKVLEANGGGPMRQKKLRTAVIGGIHNADEEKLKAEFAEAFESLCSEEENKVFLHGGMVTLIEQASQKEAADGPDDVEVIENGDSGLEDSILDALGTLGGGPIRLKKLRQTIMNEFQVSEQDSVFKAKFASAFESLLTNGSVAEESGMVTMLVEKPNKKRKFEHETSNVGSSSAKRAAAKVNLANDSSAATDTFEMWRDGEKAWKDGTLDYEYLCSNPDKITRIFCGNLNLNITEEQLKGAINGITYIKWMTDKQTRKFYGSTFLEMKDPKAAADAVALDKTKLMGRPLKIYYCPPRPGDVWPPIDGGRSGGNKPASRVQQKPEGCRTLFLGNLSYDIDDDTIVDFFKDCGTMTGLRWLTHKDSGDFRGCGYVEFATTQQADKAILLNGTELLGRPIRIDWDGGKG